MASTQHSKGNDVLGEQVVRLEQSPRKHDPADEEVARRRHGSMANYLLTEEEDDLAAGFPESRLATPSGEETAGGAQDKGLKFYWIIDHETLVWAPGIFVPEGENDREMQVMCIVDNDRYMIDKPAQEIDSELLKECIETGDLYPLSEPPAGTVTDKQLHEGAVLHVLRDRWNDGQPYSRIADRLIIEVSKDVDGHFARADLMNQLCQARDTDSLLLVQATPGLDCLKEILHNLPADPRLEAAVALMEHTVFNDGRQFDVELFFTLQRGGTIAGFRANFERSRLDYIPEADRPRVLESLCTLFGFSAEQTKFVEHFFSEILNEDLEVSGKDDYSRLIEELFGDLGEAFCDLKQELLAGIDDESQDYVLSANSKVTKWLWNLINTNTAATGKSSMRIICACAGGPSYSTKALIDEHFQDTFNPFVLFYLQPTPATTDAIKYSDEVISEEDGFDSLFVCKQILGIGLLSFIEAAKPDMRPTESSYLLSVNDMSSHQRRKSRHQLDSTANNLRDGLRTDEVNLPTIDDGGGNRRTALESVQLSRIENNETRREVGSELGQNIDLEFDDVKEPANLISGRSNKREHQPRNSENPASTSRRSQMLQEVTSKGYRGQLQTADLDTSLALDLESLGRIGGGERASELINVDLDKIDVKELRAQYITKCNENKELKSQISRLKERCKQRDQHVLGLEAHIKSLEDSAQAERETHCEKITNLVQTLDFTRSMSSKIQELTQIEADGKIAKVGRNGNLDAILEQLDLKELEIEKLKNQCDILEADVMNKGDIERQLRDENQQLKEKDNRWYKKLQVEMEQNAEDVKGLNVQIFQLKEENKRLKAVENTKLSEDPAEEEGGRRGTRDQKEFKAVLKSLQSQLAEKAKYVEELQNQRFVLQHTVARENADLKLKWQDASNKLEQREYNLRQKAKQLEEANEEIKKLSELVKNLRAEEMAAELRVHGSLPADSLPRGDDKFRESAGALTLRQEGSKGGSSVEKSSQDQAGSSKRGSNKSLRKSGSTQGKRELEKLRSRLVMSSRECEHLKQQNKDLKLQREDYINQVKTLERQVEALQEENTAQRRISASAPPHLRAEPDQAQNSVALQDKALAESKALLAEAKSKYNRLKEKCINLNKENEFYNQAMDILVRIRKVLAKQNSYLMGSIERERGQRSSILQLSKEQTHLLSTQQSIVRQGQGSIGGPSQVQQEVTLKSSKKPMEADSEEPSQDLGPQQRLSLRQSMPSVLEEHDEADDHEQKEVRVDGKAARTSTQRGNIFGRSSGLRSGRGLRKDDDSQDDVLQNARACDDKLAELDKQLRRLFKGLRAANSKEQSSSVTHQQEEEANIEKSSKQSGTQLATESNQRGKVPGPRAHRRQRSSIHRIGHDAAGPVAESHKYEKRDNGGQANIFGMGRGSARRSKAGESAGMRHAADALRSRASANQRGEEKDDLQGNEDGLRKGNGWAESAESKNHRVLEHQQATGDEEADGIVADSRPLDESVIHLQAETTEDKSGLFDLTEEPETDRQRVVGLPSVSSFRDPGTPLRRRDSAVNSNYEPEDASTLSQVFQSSHKQSRRIRGEHSSQSRGLVGHIRELATTMTSHRKQQSALPPNLGQSPNDDNQASNKSPYYQTDWSNRMEF